LKCNKILGIREDWKRAGKFLAVADGPPPLPERSA
jgi:hypothetical protein